MAVATAPAPATPALPAAPSATPVHKDPTLLAMALVIVAETMVLGGLLAAYFAVRAEAFVWPPAGVKHATYIPGTITLTVLMSMATAQWAVFAIRRNDHRNCAVALGTTIFFGIQIAVLEWYSYGRLGFSISRHAYGTMHYLLTGFYLANLLAGIVMVAVVMVRMLAGDYDENHHGAVRAVTWFWQFASIAWLIVFAVLIVFI
jgi:heme/copper-type cytochrome/quinol oxidase subunit 3